jgi:hypothetical protein
VVAGHPAADHSAAGDLLAPLGWRAASPTTRAFPIAR